MGGERRGSTRPRRRHFNLQRYFDGGTDQEWDVETTSQTAIRVGTNQRVTTFDTTRPISESLPNVRVDALLRAGSFTRSYLQKRWTYSECHRPPVKAAGTEVRQLPSKGVLEPRRQPLYHAVARL